MPRRPHPWPTYAGALFAALALAWSVASAWFDLQHRVKTLEEKQRFVHGDFEMPKGDR